MRAIELPGEPSIRLEHLVLDLNGTLSDRGVLIAGVAERIQRLAGELQVHLLTADTLGTAAQLANDLGLTVRTIVTGSDKAAFVVALGADATAAIGNGRNDAAMMRAARLAIAILGPEGAATEALLATDIVCRSTVDALDLLLDDRLLVATLRP
jgi:P-type E1-E2 ATPase